MLKALVVLASSAEGSTSKSPFYLFAGCLAIWAVMVSGLGIARQQTFPPTKGTQALVITLTTGLVLGTAFAAALTGG